ALRSLLKADLIPASLTIGVGLTDSLHLDNDLPFGPAHLEIRKRLLRLIERKYLVDHRPDAPHLEKLTDLCELATVWIHEQERILDASFLGEAMHLIAQQPQ